jgi:hypothetical protein
MSALRPLPETNGDGLLCAGNKGMLEQWPTWDRTVQSDSGDGPYIFEASKGNASNGECCIRSRVHREMVKHLQALQLVGSDMGQRSRR